jgi:4-diphosphocytidyl-2-C-methyl-D-erythritol kinase
LDYALQLGSDCPFFIINQPCYASSRGELLENVSIDLSKYTFLIINPGIHISTSWAFDNIDAHIPLKSVKEIIHQPVSTWKSELINDFEEPILNQYPKIKTIKNRLYAAGALYVSMTGSGSTLYGIFEKGKVPELYFEEDFFYSVYDV